MLDEPSLGLAPVLVDEVLDTVRKLKEEGMTILLVEQNVREALDLADRGYILQTGRIVGEGTGAELMASDQVKSAFYCGISELSHAQMLQFLERKIILHVNS
jgi:branched-chain amino acid transport system ATP-binding protein